ncbi:ATP-grasp domain-containing protein [Dyadobacter tibetensis]|uniref:ATP-grasp domain-containing protein n=1 Tax=Dyadobacter tibetensis TaxID=1211851 RepID=UPI0004726636|nr:ATPase [Dyadobacter tibetensis]
MSAPYTFLCISTIFKGNDFLQACKESGNTVWLITDSLLAEKPWVRESIDTIFYVDQLPSGGYDLGQMVEKLAIAMRSQKIDRVVALDDLDMERAAQIREYFRIPGMGQTTGSYFRDKLAMRTKALEAGIRVPGFSALFNDAEIEAFIAEFPGPWMLKPRSEAKVTGIQKLHTAEALWAGIQSLGSDRHAYLVEKYTSGDVFHIDSITYNGRVVFLWSSQYLSPPFEVASIGGIFKSITVPFDSAVAHSLETMAVDLLKAFGLTQSASHTEIIRSHDDGRYYFLETSSRVVGAYLSEMVEASSGVNLWKEWAKMETAVVANEVYKLPPLRQDYAGIIKARVPQEWADDRIFDDPEIFWRMNEPYQIGLVVRASTQQRVMELLDKYTLLIQEQFLKNTPDTSLPANSGQ